MRIKFLSFVLIITFLLIPQVGFTAENNISVILDNKTLTFDQPPVSINDRTLVPMRAVFEAFGAEIKWYEDKKQAEAYLGDTCVVLQIDNPNAAVYVLRQGAFLPSYQKDKDIVLDVPPQTINDRTMVPLRFVGESLGAKVFWEDDTKTVRIFSDPYGVDCRKYQIEQNNKKEAAIDRSSGKPLDKKGTEIHVGDIVGFGGFSGSVLQINGSKVLVYWDSRAAYIDDGNVDTWATLAGIKWKSNQWLESKEVTIESSGY